MIRSQSFNENTALGLFKYGYVSDRYMSYTMPASKKFFKNLRKAIITELEIQGFCELADTLIAGEYTSINVIVYAVFKDIEENYEKKQLRDPISLDYVPYVKDENGNPVKWPNNYKDGWFKLNREIRNTICGARDVVLRIHNENIAQKKNEAAKEEREARKEAENIINEAREKAESIINEARAEAERVKKQQNIEGQRIENEQNKLNEQAKKLINSYIAEEQKAYKHELDEKMVQFSNSYLNETKRAAAIHGEMCNETNKIQAQWVSALENTLEQLREVKAEFYSHLHKWQVALYPSELKSLAERYLELYQIINVDKLLRSEILFHYAGDGDQNNQPAECTITGLQTLNRTLSTFLRKFEVSLNGLDIYVYYPKKGETFDEIWHVLEDDDIECCNQKIVECVVPGIAKKASDDYGDDVLIQAVVRVEAENGYENF